MHQTTSHPEIAGRVVVNASSKHHGIALWPPPSSDPKDPLRWRKRVKIAAICAVGIFNFTANFAASGLSVATPVLEAQFRKSASEVNALLTYNFLLLGVGNMFWVPFATKFGKRTALLVSMSILFGVLIWTAKASSFNSLLAARCISGFVSAAGESIVPGIVSDIFFLHERAAMMSIYVMFTAGATAIGPLIAGFVVADAPQTWRDFSWVCVALAGFNLILIFLVYPESTYYRHPDQSTAMALHNMEKVDGKDTHIESLYNLPQGTQHVDHIEVDWKSVWFGPPRYDHRVSFWQAFCRPLTALLYLDVLWAVFVYGTALAAQIILIFAFPSLLLAPPYLFAPTSVGLMQVAAIIAIAVACFGGGYIADLITTRAIIRQNGQVYAEQRLLSLVPGCWIAPLGCIIVAITCANKLSWIGIAFGFGMVSFGTVYSPNIAVTYVVECHPEHASDNLVAINVFKNLVAFVFLFVAVDWVHSQGWVQVYMIMLMLTVLAALLAIPLYFTGEKLRRIMDRKLSRGDISH